MVLLCPFTILVLWGWLFGSVIPVQLRSDLECQGNDERVYLYEMMCNGIPARVMEFTMQME